MSSRRPDRRKGAQSHSLWWEISIDVDPIARDSLSTFLFDLGCSGIVSENFQDQSLKAYLPFREDVEDLRRQLHSFVRHLREIFPDVQSPRIEFRKIRDEDWYYRWRRFFHADRITPKLLIIPAWEPVPSSADYHVIRIDPGPAFGTGKHPSTRLCIVAMERLQLPAFWTMLDVGTGSGILALYGAKLGAKKIVALDLDLDALRWAERNIKLNSLEGFIELSSQPLSDQPCSFSLLAANLSLREIDRIFPCFRSHLDPGGWLILSGILKDQVKEIRGSFAENGFHEDRVQLMEGWACIVARKKKNGVMK